jgi:hypothetical protein
MSEQDPFEPPQSELSGGPGQSPGSVGLGIFLAFLLLPAGLLLLRVWLFGCLGGPLLFAATILTAHAMGKPKTVKGLWIGLVICLGVLLLAVGTIWVVCSGTKF